MTVSDILLPVGRLCLYHYGTIILFVTRIAQRDNEEYLDNKMKKKERKKKTSSHSIFEAITAIKRGDFFPRKKRRGLTCPRKS